MHASELQTTVAAALRIALRETTTPLPRLRRAALRAIEIVNAYPEHINDAVLTAFWNEYPECTPKSLPSSGAP